MDVAERMNAMLIVIAPILPILIARLHFRYIHIPFLCALCTLRSIYIIALPNTVETVLLEQGVLGCTLHVIDSILYVCWIHVKSRCSRRFDCALIFGIRIVHVYICMYIEDTINEASTIDSLLEIFLLLTFFTFLQLILGRRIGFYV